MRLDSKRSVAVWHAYVRSLRTPVSERKNSKARFALPKPCIRQHGGIGSAMLGCMMFSEVHFRSVGILKTAIATVEETCKGSRLMMQFVRFVS